MAGRSGAFVLGAACVAVGVGIGVLATRPAPVLPPVELYATASQAHDNFVIATGFVDEGMEALYFLDFLTGDLKATVINERRPGFAAFYEYNIAADFNLGTVKNPKYLMVTGVARNARNAGAGGQLSHSILYVVEASTGQLMAYGLPWNPSLAASGKPQRGSFIPIARTALRTAFVRDQ